MLRASWQVGGIALDEVYHLVQGAPNTSVRLQLARAPEKGARAEGKQYVVELRRSRIEGMENLNVASLARNAQRNALSPAAVLENLSPQVLAFKFPRLRSALLWCSFLLFSLSRCVCLCRGCLRGHAMRVRTLSACIAARLGDGHVRR